MKDFQISYYSVLINILEVATRKFVCTLSSKGSLFANKKSNVRVCIVTSSGFSCGFGKLNTTCSSLKNIRIGMGLVLQQDIIQGIPHAVYRNLLFDMCFRFSI